MHTGSTTSSGNTIPPDDRESIPLTEAADRLAEQGIAAARAGQRQEALGLLDQALALNDDHVEALLWRGGLSDANQALPFLEHAVALDPSNQRARDGLDWARQRVGLAPRPAAISQRPPANTARPAPPAYHPPAAPSRTAQTLQQHTFTSTTRPAQTPYRQPVAPRPAAAPVINRPTVSAAGGVATPATVPLDRPMAPGIDLMDMLGRAVSFLIERPTLALIISMLLLGLLGTAAVARAGMSNHIHAPQATPQVINNATNSAALSFNPTAVPATARAGTTTTSSAPAAAAAPVANATTLDQAWAANDWPLAILILDEMLRRTPNDAALTQKIFTAYVNHGVQLVRSERLPEAIAAFDKALAINPQDSAVLGERRFAQLYNEGSTALAAGNFYAAITPLRTIYDGNPNYRSATARLYQSYIGYAAALEKEGKRADAYLYYQKATRIDAQGADGLAGLARLKDVAPATAAAAANKKIDVDLAKQQVTVTDNGKVLWRFKVSTGAAPYVTRTGEFEILNKIDHAYSSAMEWGMPYWMGVYQAGGTENGFHAMARLSNGSVLSTSVLGRPATRGCIMLSDADARTLYNWAVVGIPVSIHN
jgi:tetratricopeptide (TPR) repeat protein